MGNSYIGNAATFLVEWTFGLYALIVMLRFLFQIFRADFYNPVSQTIVRLTNPPLLVLRRFVPSALGLDTASIVLIFGLKGVELWLRFTLGGGSTSVAGLAVLTLGEVLAMSVNIFLFAIIIQVVISWINPGVNNPITSLLHGLTEPLLRPVRRLLPPAGGLDFSPMLAMVGLILVTMLVVAPIRDQGKLMMMASVAGVM
jgi:YggT family protein